MQECTVQLDEAEFECCQPVEMAWIHGTDQRASITASPLPSRRASGPAAAHHEAALGQQLLFPPAVDALWS